MFVLRRLNCVSDSIHNQTCKTAQSDVSHNLIESVFEKINLRPNVLKRLDGHNQSGFSKSRHWLNVQGADPQI